MNFKIKYLHVFFILFPAIISIAHADDAWWNDGWPYRVRVNVNESGIVDATINFTDLFNELGLNQGLLDIRSLRVVPYSNGWPQEPVIYAETYSNMLEDADNPQIGWHSDGVYWSVNDGSAEADHSRFSQGNGSLKAVIENWTNGYGYPGVEFRISSGDARHDWSSYETLVYDVWPVLIRPLQRMFIKVMETGRATGKWFRPLSRILSITGSSPRELPGLRVLIIPAA